MVLLLTAEVVNARVARTLRETGRMEVRRIDMVSD